MNESPGSSDAITDAILADTYTSLADTLLSAESVFRWKPKIFDENRHMIDREVVKKGKFSYLNFIIDITDVYEKFNVDILEAGKAIDSLEKEINHLKESGEDEIFNQIEDALFHITYTTKARFFLSVENHAEWTSILSCIKEPGKMNKRNTAAMRAIQSSVISLYSYDGTNAAISLINIALTIDPEWPLWHFVKGWYLYRLRFWESPNKEPSAEERRLFEKANGGSADSALFMVYLADTYRDHAVYLKNRSEDCLLSNDSKNKLIEERYAKSSDLYKKSHDLEPENPNVSFRVAYGMMKLPNKYQDLKLVKAIINDTSPKFIGSGFGNFVQACYYQHFGKNEPLAMRHFESSADLKFFAAHLSILIFKSKDPKQTSSNEAVQYLEDLLNVFKETPHVNLITVQIVSFYVFVDFSLEKACKYALKSLEVDACGKSLQNHRSCFLSNANNRNFSLIDVLTDGVKYKLGDPKIESVEEHFFSDFIHEVTLRKIKMVPGKPRNLRQQILDVEAGKRNSNRKFQSVQYDSNMRNPRNSKNNPSENSRGNTNTGKFRPIPNNLNAFNSTGLSDMQGRNPSNPKSESNPAKNSPRKTNIEKSRPVPNDSNAKNLIGSRNLHGENPRWYPNSQKNNSANSHQGKKVESARGDGNTSLSSRPSTKANVETLTGDRNYRNVPPGKSDIQANLSVKQATKNLVRERSHSRETVKSSKIEKNNNERNTSEVIDEVTKLLKKQKLRDDDRGDSKRNRERSNSRDTVRSSRKAERKSHRRDRSPSDDSYSDDKKYRKSGKNTRSRRKDSSSSERSHSSSPGEKSERKHHRRGSRNRSRSSSKKRHHRRGHPRSRDRSASFYSNSDDEKYRKSGEKAHSRRKDSLSSERSRPASPGEKSKRKHHRRGSRNRSRSSSKKRHHRRGHPRSRDRSASFHSYSDEEKYRKSGRKTHSRRKDSSSSRLRSVSREEKSKRKHRRHGSRDRSERRDRSHSSSRKRHHRRHHSRSQSRGLRRRHKDDRADRPSPRRPSTNELEFVDRTSKARSPSKNSIKSHRTDKANSSRSRDHSASPNPIDRGGAEKPVMKREANGDREKVEDNKH